MINAVDMNKSIVWVHADVLSPYGPALAAAPDAPALFVWDEVLLKDWRISLKRITFIYECLLELPVTIRRGDVAEELVRFALENGAGRVLTAESPSPRFRGICQQVGQAMPKDSQLEVEVLRIDPFIDYDGHIDLKRFSRYWRTVSKYAMQP